MGVALLQSISWKTAAASHNLIQFQDGCCKEKQDKVNEFLPQTLPIFMRTSLKLPLLQKSKPVK